MGAALVSSVQCSANSSVICFPVLQALLDPKSTHAHYEWNWPAYAADHTRGRARFLDRKRAQLQVMSGLRKPAAH